MMTFNHHGPRCESGEVVTTLQCPSDSPKGLVKTKIDSTTPRVSDSVGLGWAHWIGVPILECQLVTTFWETVAGGVHKGERVLIINLGKHFPCSLTHFFPSTHRFIGFSPTHSTPCLVWASPGAINLMYKWVVDWLKKLLAKISHYSAHEEICDFESMDPEYIIIGF